MKYIKALFFISIVSFLFACHSVHINEPFPIGNIPSLTELPLELKGKYKVLAEGKSIMGEKDLGTVYLEIEYKDTKHCVGRYYSAFTPKEFEKSKNKKYFLLRERQLIYRNDTLLAQYDALIAKKKTGELTQKEKDNLSALERDKKNKLIRDTIELTIENNMYVYGKGKYFEIDLKKNTMTYFTEEEPDKSDKLSMRKYKNSYFINVFDEKHKVWNPMLIELKKKDILVKMINIEHFGKKLSKYEKIAKVEKMEGSDYLLSPTAAQFEKLMKSGKLFETSFTFKRIEDTKK